MPFQEQWAIARGLEHPGAAKGRGLVLLGWEKATRWSRTFQGYAGAFGIHREGVCPCSTSRGTCLALSGAPETLDYPQSHTGGIHLQAQPSLYAWVFPQWILVKLYLEKLYFNVCDGNSPLKNGFAITVVVLLKLPDCLPWQRGPARQWKVSWAR